MLSARSGCSGRRFMVNILKLSCCQRHRGTCSLGGVQTASPPPIHPIPLSPDPGLSLLLDNFWQFAESSNCQHVLFVCYHGKGNVHALDRYAPKSRWAGVGGNVDHADQGRQRGFSRDRASNSAQEVFWYPRVGQTARQETSYCQRIRVTGPILPASSVKIDLNL